jgi:hypothetical protein
MPTEKKTEISGVNIFRFADSKVAEIWNYQDALSLREQLGFPIYAGSNGLISFLSYHNLLKPEFVEPCNFAGVKFEPFEHASTIRSFPFLLAQIKRFFHVFLRINKIATQKNRGP